MAAEKISIVGAGGFIGARLAERLRRDGAEPRLYFRQDRDRLLSEEHGTLFYCAGFTGDFARHPHAMTEAHVGLLNAILKAGRFERLVYLSSTRVYDSSGVELADEQTILKLSPFTPRHIYDFSKGLGEALCLQAGQGRCRIARLSNVFDFEGFSTGFVSEWLVRARAERLIALDSTPHGARDYIHIDDVIAGLLAIAKAPEGGIWNLASGRNTSNGEIAAVLARHGRETRFARDESFPVPPKVSIARLEALGVTVTSPLERIDAAFRKSE